MVKLVESKTTYLIEFTKKELKSLINNIPQNCHPEVHDIVLSLIELEM